MNDIVFARRGALGLITLNRPKVLNALDAGMIGAMRRSLDAWAADDGVGVVVVRGDGERAFCAGGDIRMFYQSAATERAEARAFWAAEYGLIVAIKRYPKPYLALMHGITMGGGLGISVNGAWRVAGENLIAAMPETDIGFYPDVGASFFLSRAPGECGLYLALTGARVKRDDALYLGLVTHGLAQSKWPDLLEALASGEPVGDLLSHARADARTHAGEAVLARHRQQIDAAFSAASVEEILARLDADGSSFARETASLIRRHSPMSLKIAFRAQREGKKLSFEDCMRMEYRLSAYVQKLPDFREGIRAKIIDKDNRPLWHPPRLADVSERAVDMCFAAETDDDISI
jgi:enoyl-CoA hydratase